MSDKSQHTIRQFKDCCSRQGVDIINSSNTEVSFATKGYLEYFDEDVASAIIGNKQSIVYRPGGHDYSGHISYADIERLMTAILLDGTLKVKLCAAFKYDIDQGISGVSYRFGQGYSSYMLNPLTQLFRDLGSGWVPIHHFLSKNDFDNAIRFCVMFGNSLDLRDAAITQIFMEALYGARDSLNNNCIELPNGDTVTPKDAVAWLKQNKRGGMNVVCASGSIMGNSHTPSAMSI